MSKSTLKASRKIDLDIPHLSVNIDSMDKSGAVKPKKFALPRFYVRNSRAIDTLSDMTDDLSPENYTVSEKASTSDTTVTTELHLEVANQDTILDEKQEVNLEKKKGKAKKTANNNTNVKTETKPKATKAPTAYNIFIKETCETLTNTRANLTPRERYALAIQMWNDRKGA
jgi:hypothetical protein